MKEVEVGVVGWGGGCFGDEYEWMDGMGGKENGGKMMNKKWGGSMEEKSLGREELVKVWEMLGWEG